MNVLLAFSVRAAGAKRYMVVSGLGTRDSGGSRIGAGRVVWCGVGGGTTTLGIASSTPTAATQKPPTRNETLGILDGSSGAALQQLQ